MNGGSNRWRGALEMVMRHKPTKRKKCRCGVVIRESSNNCAMCHRRRRHRRVRAVIVLGLLLMFIGCKTPTPVPAPKIVHLRGHIGCYDAATGPVFLPRATKTEPKRRAVHPMAAVAPEPPPPVTKTHTWKWRQDTNCILTVVHTTTDLRNWSYYDWTSNTQYTVYSSRPRQFFHFMPVTNGHSLRIGRGLVQPPDF